MHSTKAVCMGSKVAGPSMARSDALNALSQTAAIAIGLQRHNLLAFANET